MSPEKRPPRSRQDGLNCRQPDRDAPALVCGYPLPCPWHTAVIDISTDPARVVIPITAGAALKAAPRLKQLARVLADTPPPKPRPRRKRR